MEHATVKLIKSLSLKKNRDAHGLFVVEGEKLVSELLQSPFTVKKIVYSKPLPCRVPAAVSEQVSAAVMARISGLKTPPSVLAVAVKPEAAALPAIRQNELYLALDNVQDPGNLGTIVRIADWFGIRHIFCTTDTADCYNPKVVQSTMGAIFRVQVHYTALAAFLQHARKTIPVYGTFLDGDNLYQKPLTAGGIIVMGNEGNGIAAEVAQAVTERLFIPPYPAAGNTSESLNVAAGTAIVCAEFRRRAAVELRTKS